MKKGFFGKLLIKLSCVVLALMCGFACCACKTNEAYGNWQHDEKYHWRYNSKGEIVDKAIHNFLWWKCTLCDYTIDPPEPEAPPPELPEDPDPPVEDEEPEDDEPAYDEPLPEDPWVDDPEDPWDDPTDDPPEEEPPIEEPSEDDPEEDPPVEEPPQEEPSEDDPPEEEPPVEEPPEEEPPQEEPPKEEQKPEQKPQEQKPETKPSTPSKPSTPTTPTKPTKPTEPNYESGSDWSDWPEVGGGTQGGEQGGTQGGEGAGGTGGSAGGGNTPVQPNLEAQGDLIYFPIYSGLETDEIIAYSVKADERNTHKYIEIPDQHLGKPVTVIEEQGFMNLKNLQTIRLPSCLERINHEAFSGSTLKEIYIPDSVEFIDRRVFASCPNLNKVRLPNNVNYTKIEYELFHNCPSLGRIVIPDSVTLITTRAFEYAKLQSLVVGRGVKTFGHQAFNESSIKQGILIYDLVQWCKIEIDSQISSPLYWGHRFFLWENGKAKEIENLVIPDEITELGRFQFGGCTSITRVDMSKVKSVRDEVFIHCTYIEEVILPESLPEFTANLFYDCRSLEEIVIPDGITQIPYCCFYNCKCLKKLTIPKSVTYFGSLSIDGCASLKEIVYKGTMEEWKNISIRDEWMWYNGTGDFVIKCENGDIEKLEDRARFENPFDKARREMEEKYGTGYLTVGRREEAFD